MHGAIPAAKIGLFLLKVRISQGSETRYCIQHRMVYANLEMRITCFARGSAGTAW